jgi:DNA-directed RNA polymerase beta' subunit
MCIKNVLKMNPVGYKSECILFAFEEKMLSGLQLRYYTNEEIKSLAVVKVTNPGTYDRGIPKLEGITDPRMGVVDHTIRCPTCNKGSCDQHLG